MDAAVAKLASIHELLKELKRTRETTPEHEAILTKIRTHSSEYEALTEESER